MRCKLLWDWRIQVVEDLELEEVSELDDAYGGDRSARDVVLSDGSY